jgi:Domain of unknown function (DUF4747)
MRTTRTIEISALNIAMHQPHSPQRYVSLFWDAKRSRKLVQIGQLHGALIGRLGGGREYVPGMLIVGEIYRFVKIDAALPWFNTLTSEPASEGDLEGLSIPEHLLPNLRRIEFTFRPDIHRLWFISKDRDDRLGPMAAERFFQTLFDSVAQEQQYPKVEVTVVPDKESIEELLSTPRMERVHIELKRPNPDDSDDLQVRWMRKLQNNGARSMVTTLTAADASGLTLDEETKGLARASALNGHVVVTARNATGKRFEESTRDKPLAIPETVDSEIEVSQDVLDRVARLG